MGVNLIEVVRLTSLLHNLVAPQMSGRLAGIGTPPLAGPRRDRRRSTEDRIMPKAPKFLEGQLHWTVATLWIVVSSHGHLICQHDAEGAFGLVLNDSAATRWDARGGLPDRIKNSRSCGGLFRDRHETLHTDSYLLPSRPPISGEPSLDELVELGDSFSSTQQFRLFAGYAGWSPGQLENEMRRNAWLVHPATVDLVFHTEPARLWQHILRKKGWRYRLLAESPEDLSWN